MNKYQEAIDYFEYITNGCDIDTAYFVGKHLDALRQLLYQYQMRLSDAELLNKLRSITGTMGDLDLFQEVQRLVFVDTTRESDKDIFCPTGK